MERKGLPDLDVPGTSGLNTTKNGNSEMEASGTSIHNLQHENLHLEGVVVYDQRKLEQGLMDQMDQVFNQQQKSLETKRAKREIKRVEEEIREVRLRIKQAGRTLEIASSQNNNKDTRKRLESVRCQKSNKENQLKMLQAKLRRLHKVVGISPVDASQEDIPILEEEVEQAASSSASWALTGKTDDERERLIKLGLMTPFGSMVQDDEFKEPSEPKKRKLLLDDGFSDFLTSQKRTKKSTPKAKSKKSILTKETKEKQFKIPKKKNTSSLKAWIEDKANDDGVDVEGSRSPCDKWNKQQDGIQNRQQSLENTETPTSDDEYVPNEDDREIEQQDIDDEEFLQDIKPKKKPKYNPETGSPIFDYEDELSDISAKRNLKRPHKVIDDGKLTNYKKRMKKYKEDMKRELAEGKENPEDKNLGNDYKVPGKIWSRLYKYQRTGVRWLCELQSQRVGGILGDEMGLGKTVQIIAFLATIRQSNLRSRSVPGYAYEGLGPVLIITPTTVMHQWVKEFHTWWPEARVAILHDSGTYESSRAQLVDNIAESRGILITSYDRARINVDMLLEQGWHYVILDEGHKIRNPEAAVTVALKLFRTPHRLILSGSPVQNNLKELWSLFDFIFPGKLGTLAVFMEQFSVPIVQGGYSNATEIQVHTAYKCACKLRDTISPYLLRRMKRDVQLSLELPSKNEQVLFCWLSEEQIKVYQKYLDSDQVHSILTREMKVFAGLIQLRKICNHPDLYTGGPKIMVGEATPSPRDKRSFGYYKRSGKMLVIASLLKSWKKQGHKVLLFTQSRTMLDILEIYLSSREYKYLTMHGGTPVQTRHPLINQFNQDPSIFVFLLTTRVGGLGVNLTGANRVVIYDPDWNPSTDSQAQERAWRIGQQRDVTIYRLLTLGTIEEKIYHRQIFKQFLTNRVLKDPWQRRFFKSNDLHELFILKDYGSGKASRSKDDVPSTSKSETASIFAGTGSEVKPESVKKRLDDMKDSKIKSSDSPTDRKTALRTEDTENPKSAIKITDENSAFPNNQTDLSNRSPSAVESTTQINVSTTDELEIEKPDNVTPCDARKLENKRESMVKISSLKESLMRAREKFEKQKLAEKCIDKKKLKKKYKHKPVVDGEPVKNLASVKNYKVNGGASEAIEEKSRRATDDYVLHKLFEKAGVHSALQHNTIMESSHPDYALVEVEAERVAKESVRNLRLSRRLYKYPTGRQPGSSSKPRFGNNSLKKNIEKDDSAILKAENSVDHLFKATHLKENTNDNCDEDSNQSDSPVPLSASQLLSMMRRRNHEEIHKQEEEDSARQEEERDMFGFLVSQSNDGGTVTMNPTEHDELMEDLRNFIAFECLIDGRARTSEIMSRFGSKIKPSHAAIFKSILKELCTCEKSVDSDENVWFLKSEFR